MEDETMAQRVEFETPSGARAQGELVEPAGGGKAPAVVLIHEWWGVNAHIRSLLDRLAAAGFVAFAPDLYEGRVARDAQEASAMMNALDRAAAMDKIAGAARFLAAHPRANGKVGVIGFCMGGALAFAASTQVPEFAAVVPFYGVPQQADYSKTRAPVLAHFATRDNWATVDAARAIQAEIQRHGGTMELQVYDAEHAFVNDTRPEVYHPEAAKLAWERSMAFLHRHLG
jgi:carboxymethylenebutenolidase